MKIKTSTLTDMALDWAVAKAKGLTLDSLRGGAVWAWTKDALTGEDETIEIFRPSRDGAQGWPIIDRENITVVRCNNDYVKVDGEFKHVPRWFADCPGQYYGYEAETSYEGEHFDPTFMIDASDGCYGPTSLVAAMRSYVRRKLGNEIDIPDDLLET